MEEGPEKEYSMTLDEIMQKSEPQMRKMRRQFNNAALRARAGLFWEGLWPRLVPVLCTGGAFAALSWTTGLWGAMPVAGRVAGVLGTVFAAAVLASPLVIRARPLRVGRDEAMRRLDDVSKDPLRPAQTIGDHPGEQADKIQRDLWDMHLIRMWNRSGGTFRSGVPHPGMKRHDPYGIRYMTAAVVLAAGVFAGEQREERLMAAFDWSGSSAAAADMMRIKAWVTPPENVGTPPLFLTEESKDETQGGSKLVAHKNSTLLIRTYGQNPRITINGKEITPKKQDSGASVALQKQEFQYEMKLNEKSSVVSIRNGPTWNFTVLPDNPPAVVIHGVAPAPSNKDSLDITYSAEDDFGVRQSELIVHGPKEGNGKKPLPSSKIPPVILP